MINKLKIINYCLMTKSFLTGKSMPDTSLSYELDEGINNVRLRFLVAAPFDYNDSDPEVINVFLDKQDHDRELAENNYQIQCYESFDDQDFKYWAERTIKILYLSSISSFVHLGFSDLIKMLEACKGNNIIFRTFTATEIIKSRCIIDSLFGSPYILAFIASKDDLGMDEFRLLCDSISKHTDKSAQLRCAVFKWPDLQGTEVSLLYAEKAITEENSNEQLTGFDRK